MDDRDCDPVRLRNTYAQFRFVNPFIAGWRRIYRDRIRPLLAEGARSILDIGCGGGDLLIVFSKWARADGLTVDITGIDPNPRALDYLKSLELPEDVAVRGVLSKDLVREGRTYDIVLSNHVLHHLAGDQLLNFLDNSRRLARRLALHNDIRRDDLAFLSFAATRVLFWNSFITADGLTSIRRSYLPDELRSAVDDPWRVETMMPYRNLLILEP
jgi:2-polyprenyl-3-methyl-5-hydroxy-6-metoxy-1,4-benzoquinol methylase